MSKPIIKIILHRAGGEPSGYWVGYGFPKVTRIDVREADYGTYSIDWFEVYSDDILVASMNALHVAEVVYDSPTADAAVSK